MPSADSEFWAFSLSLYRQEGVELALLSLQDEDGLDVNLVLFALWSGHCGLLLDASALSRIEHSIGAWQRDVVAQLRKLRRSLKPDAMTDPLVAELRNGIKALEIEAERIQQLRLEAWASELEGRLEGDARAVIEINLEQLCTGLSKRGNGALLIDRVLALKPARGQSS